MNRDTGASRPGWAPADVDTTRPSVARVYDYYLGGPHNFAVDREAARRTLARFPEIQRGVHANRAFMRRAVRCLLAQGVTQFLDIGSGIPTVGNVHEVAQAVDPRCRVLYVDVDPVAVTHSRAVLADTPYTGVVRADIREPDRILAAAETRRLLDLDRPVALLMLAVLPFVPDSDDPAGLVRRYRDRLAPGSHLALTHRTHDDCTGQQREFTAFKATYDRQVAATTTRSRAEIQALFHGFDLVEPGVAWLSDWRPDPEEERVPTPGYGAVGRSR